MSESDSATSGAGAAAQQQSSAGSGDAARPPAVGEHAVVVRTPDGWRVGGVDVPDLTSAMVLADLLASELAAADSPTGPIDVDAVQAAAQKAEQAARENAAAKGSRGKSRRRSGREAVPAAEVGAAAATPAAAAATDPNKLRATIGQLEHALTARVRVEQAIGVLAERHRIQPRQAFEQLRAAARSRGKRVIDVASDVVASATNPLLQLPDELSRPRSGGRHSRRPRRVLGSD